jgi:hypothetical protein
MNWDKPLPVLLAVDRRVERHNVHALGRILGGRDLEGIKVQ